MLCTQDDSFQPSLPVNLRNEVLFLDGRAYVFRLLQLRQFQRLRRQIAVAKHGRNRGPNFALLNLEDGIDNAQQPDQKATEGDVAGRV